MLLDEKWNELNRLRQIVDFWLESEKENCLSDFYLTLLTFADSIALTRRYFLFCFAARQLNMPCETEMNRSYEMTDIIRNQLSLILIFDF